MNKRNLKNAITYKMLKLASFIILVIISYSFERDNRTLFVKFYLGCLPERNVIRSQVYLFEQMELNFQDMAMIVFGSSNAV